MFLGVDYQLKSSGENGSWSASLYDGSVCVLGLSVQTSSAPTCDIAGRGPIFSRTEAAFHSEKDFLPGFFQCSTLAPAH